MATVKRTITIELEEGVAADVTALLERNGFRLEDHVVELLTLETVWVEKGDATLADAMERIRLDYAKLQDELKRVRQENARLKEKV